MEARLRQALARAEQVARALADPETARNPAKLKQLGREHARLDAIRQAHSRLERLQGELAQAREVLQDKDPELSQLARAEGNLGGLKEAIFAVRGPKVYGTLRYESGVHRVQRIPETETQGRRHTSAATVAVLPDAEEVDVKIEEKDLRIDVFRSGGPGGQSV